MCVFIICIHICVYTYYIHGVHTCISIVVYTICECMSIYLSICLSIHLSIYLSMYLSIYVSIFIYLSIHIYVPIYPSICDVCAPNPNKEGPSAQKGVRGHSHDSNSCSLCRSTAHHEVVLVLGPWGYRLHGYKEAAYQDHMVGVSVYLGENKYIYIYTEHRKEPSLRRLKTELMHNKERLMKLGSWFGLHIRALVTGWPAGIWECP